MQRDELTHGFFFRVTPEGEVPRLEEWTKAIKRLGLSNPGREFFQPPCKRVTKVRSGQQNKAVMGFWMDLIMREEYGVPYTKAEFNKTYDDLKIEMGWTLDKVNLKTGEVRKFPKPTHDLDGPKYSEWMEQFARHVAANHGINLPPPEKAMAVI